MEECEYMFGSAFLLWMLDRELKEVMETLEGSGYALYEDERECLIAANGSVPKTQPAFRIDWRQEDWTRPAVIAELQVIGRKFLEGEQSYCAAQIQKFEQRAAIVRDVLEHVFESYKISRIRDAATEQHPN